MKLANLLGASLALSYPVGACLNDAERIFQRRVPSSYYTHLKASLVTQETGHDCSAASALTILKYAQQRLRSSDPLPLSPWVFAEKVNSDWGRRVAPQGIGVHLPLFKTYFQEAWALYFEKIPLSVETFTNHGTLKHHLQKELEALATERPRHFLVLNFDQGLALGEKATLGHFAIAAGYDPLTQEVKILDPDPELKPYSLKLNKLLKALESSDDETGGPRGYLVIRLPIE